MECEDANEMHSEFDILSAKFNFDDVIFDVCIIVVIIIATIPEYLLIYYN